jgi:hypothetical protein
MRSVTCASLTDAASADDAAIVINVDTNTDSCPAAVSRDRRDSDICSSSSKSSVGAIVNWLVLAWGAHGTPEMEKDSTWESRASSITEKVHIMDVVS